MQFTCQSCGKRFPIDGLVYCCECGGLFRYEGQDIAENIPLVSLGEVQTPMLMRRFGEHAFNLKLDYFFPTGSFKDRGTQVLISVLKHLGVQQVVEDSSGNAGASMAAYAAAADIQCDIYVPEMAPVEKTSQINAYGANLVEIPGGRDATAKAVKEAATSTYYASHVFNPLFMEGTKSIAYEIYQQMGVPDAVFLPVGNGSLLLGLYRGFSELGQVPVLNAVQAENCAPIYAAFYGLPFRGKSSTKAGGIAVKSPAQLENIVSAIHESQGGVLTVNEEEIMAAKKQLALMGIYVETTAAVGVAGAQKALNDNLWNAGQSTRNEERPGLSFENSLIILTGHGLKEK